MPAAADPAPVPSRGGFDPVRLARVLRRSILPLALLAVVLFLLRFGALRVPAGMDSMPSIPPGSLCLIDKWHSSAQPGDEVFVDLPDGSVLLSRLVAVGEDGSLVVQNDADASRLPDSDQFGPLPRQRLRGTVLVVFAGQGAPGEAVRGR